MEWMDGYKKLEIYVCIWEVLTRVLLGPINGSFPIDDITKTFFQLSLFVMLTNSTIFVFLFFLFFCLFLWFIQSSSFSTNLHYFCWFWFLNFFPLCFSYIEYLVENRCALMRQQHIVLHNRSLYVCLLFIF